MTDRLKGPGANKGGVKSPPKTKNPNTKPAGQKLHPFVEVGAIPFTRKNVKKYLDEAIIFWRKKKQVAESLKKPRAADIAVHYINAFQAVRFVFFGNRLDEE